MDGWRVVDKLMDRCEKIKARGRVRDKMRAGQVCGGAAGVLMRGFTLAPAVSQAKTTTASVTICMCAGHLMQLLACGVLDTHTVCFCFYPLTTCIILFKQTASGPSDVGS